MSPYSFDRTVYSWVLGTKHRKKENSAIEVTVKPLNTGIEYKPRVVLLTIETPGISKVLQSLEPSEAIALGQALVSLGERTRTANEFFYGEKIPGLPDPYAETIVNGQFAWEPVFLEAR